MSIADKLKNFWANLKQRSQTGNPLLDTPTWAIYTIAAVLVIGVGIGVYGIGHSWFTTNPESGGSGQVANSIASSGKTGNSNSSSSSGSRSSSSGGSSNGTGNNGNGGSKHKYSQTPHTWGFIGCSNTHDIVWGYQGQSQNDLFWPASFGSDGDSNNVGNYDYSIEGQTLYRWTDSSATHQYYVRNWQMFDRMKQTYNGDQDPPVIWVQLCENVNYTVKGTYHISTYSEVVSLINSIKAHAPTSVIYLSPLNTWDKNPDGTWLCPQENGQRPQDPADGIAHMTGLIDQAINNGLALAGPGANGLSYLGPLGVENLDTDQCHPNGNPKHPPLDGGGSPILGGQLADFFDAL